MPDSNKTEQATPRRRQKAREHGQVARSREVMASLAALAAALVSAATLPAFAGQWRRLLRSSLEGAAHGLQTGNSQVGVSFFAAGAYTVLRAAGLVLVLSWMASMLGAFAQGGLVFSPAALQPTLSRLSPAARMSQLFSLPALGRMLKSLLPVAAMVSLAVALVARDWGRLLGMPHLNTGGLAGFTLGRMFEITWKCALVLLIWSAADYFLERQRLEGELRMSRQELVDEYKETEGHPAIRARIRRIQRQMRKRRMLEEVKRATVVITNPSEFAVALEYRPELPAPTVVAKGRNLVARQIKEIARWQGIPVVENPPLAHALYRAVEVGQSIPAKLYAVVAGVLAAIYRAEQQARARQASASATRTPPQATAAGGR
jgi:flagellar biosynthesis protein FlhB